MFALKSSTRSAHRLARSFATVVDSAGYKVASFDANQPTSSVTFLVKGGSRFETKPGVAHALKNFAFKSSAGRSAIGSIREAELYGGVLSASLTREHLALTAEFLRGDEDFFVKLLTEFVQSPKFAPWEWAEYVTPVVEADTAAAAADPATTALELAHTLAFRNGLGASLFAPAHNDITSTDIAAFASSAFSDVAVLGTGIDQTTLSELVKKYSKKAPASSTVSSPASTYFGGETRVAAHGPDTVFIGFGATGSSSHNLAALSAYLSPEPHVKWSEGVSALASQIPEGTSVKPVYLPYSDAALVGFLIQGNDIKTAGSAVVAALKKAASGVSAEEFTRASAKARFAAASSIESREGFVNVLGSKVLATSEPSASAFLKPFDAVTSSSVSQAAASILKSKPTFIAIGDLATIPYADEIGL
ncbi:LuxS/MPP-like metallohydrolase [Cylindrobasidium torrendii FP15055 ss-10]|uniref:Cytochrome b-c1 complex subunit 2, mitochondrial n=1 Tax=Cylindrobasidium torrendii FP15055 ss-10 TaxID=1314674 RepID=A0A0D7BI67_9AGAR|nr:LuxS/MPP-like metallohydrolase [Cylindrobasidium torrendii FP15055 ss-10]